MNWNCLSCQVNRIYQSRIFYGSIEKRRVPQARSWCLGLGVSDGRGIEALLRQRRFAFHYVQLLPPPAAIEDGACAGHFCARTCSSKNRDGLLFDRLCGDAGACAFINKRTEDRDTVGGDAKAEAARLAQNARRRRSGTITFTTWGRWRDPSILLAGSLL